MGGVGHFLPGAGKYNTMKSNILPMHHNLRSEVKHSEMILTWLGIHFKCLEDYI